ncbi:MAG: GNAT family N-acetyltransferase [Paracoccaceae bacterium]
MTEEISTGRLLLRPLFISDAADITRLIADWQVMRWLTSPPWPYALADAAWYLGDRFSNGSLAILFHGRLAGVVSVNKELGFWLGREFWGRGLMTEAAGAAVAKCFANHDAILNSGYLIGNTVSCKLLTKLGFRETAVEMVYSNPRSKDVRLQKMALTRQDWQARNG